MSGETGREPHNGGVAPSEGESNLSGERARWQARHIDEKARGILDRDAQVFFHQSLSTPCLNVLEASAGSDVMDTAGRTFLDFHGNNVHQVGHGHPRVIEAIRASLATLPFSPRRYTNEKAVQFAERLLARMPGEYRLLLAPGGAEAMGMALKLARMVTGRHKVLSFWDSFHGASLETISIGGESLFRMDAGPLLPGVHHAPPPDPPNCPFECGDTCGLRCANYVEYILEKEPDIGAVVAETIRCTPVIPPHEWWQRVATACRRHGALLIIDEIPIGLGRTGRFFTYEHYGIEPDILVLGKGLGGGVWPIAAMVARAAYNDVVADRALGHYTHEKSSVGSAAALATLEVIESEQLVEKAAEDGRWLLAALGRLRERHPLISDIRGLGLIVGIELRRGDGAKATTEAERILYGCLERGLSFKITMGNILTWTPPLTISRDDLERAVSILDAALGAATSIQAIPTTT